MILTGGYVAYYGRYEPGVLDGGDPADPVVEAAGEVRGSRISTSDILSILVVR
jgi:hypothetical protein